MKLSARVKKILANYESDTPGTKANLARILMNGRLGGTGNLVILPVDQGFEHGPARSFAPNPEAYDPHYHFQLAIDAGLSAYAAPLGMIEAGADTFAGCIPTILKLNSANSLSRIKEGADQALASAEVTVRGRIRNQRLVANPMETRGAIGDYNAGTDEFTIYTNSQAPHVHRLLFAAFVLGVIGAGQAQSEGDETALTMSRIAWIGALVLLVIGFLERFTFGLWTGLIWRWEGEAPAEPHARLGGSLALPDQSSASAQSRRKPL